VKENDRAVRGWWWEGGKSVTVPAIDMRIIIRDAIKQAWAFPVITSG